MLLEKTLHMSQPLAECKARLASIQSYRRQFLMVTRATVTSSKTVDFSFRGPLGFEAHTVLLSVDSDSPGQYAFESVGGNVSVMGIVILLRSGHIAPRLRSPFTTKSKINCLPAGSTPALRGQLCHCRIAQHPRAFRSIRSSYLEGARAMPVLQVAHA